MANPSHKPWPTVSSPVFGDPTEHRQGPDPDRKSYASYFSFTDPDGNGWTVQEITGRLPGHRGDHTHRS
ncbi:hypothetical protein AS026_13330 [Rhizobium altiplani]|uniref:VOC domain-containing protein n=1 Tax=Rhizobium altiplani TaxID=1864509 RepID=A0A120FIM5_9HYPH|nr:hypothetical protein AS026_13330 [Rhizobium altiplani]